LLEGQALFEVRRNESRPFRVVVDDARVEVLGTAFDVLRTKDGMRVVVLSGKVMLTAGATPPPAAPGPRRGARTALRRPAAAPQDVDVGLATSWREGRLVFDNVTLADAVEQLQRYRHGHIALADNAVGQMRITGSVSAADPDQLLRLLPETLPVNVYAGPEG